ncbi:unnamed protein product [Cyprideis torosa]|uniref:Peroxin-13 n=1 Tax=Cyprideis torosa TaxID=163714 RepID=A0A7R8W119_9CRUS|nr:unnamed protein product [Cyprideis torosa]CAG0880406.1 unnamed protein product [Cyprideis torosa]
MDPGSASGFRSSAGPDYGMVVPGTSSGNLGPSSASSISPYMQMSDLKARSPPQQHFVGYGGNAGYGMGYPGGMSPFYSSYPGVGVGGFSPLGGFFQDAQDSFSRSIHPVLSLVDAINSIASVINSTFGAISYSFQALLQTAHHLQHLKGQLSGSYVPLINTVKYWLQKIAFILGLTSVKPEEGGRRSWEQAFQAAHGKDGSVVTFSEVDIKGAQSPWPPVVLIGSVIGFLLLITKILKALSGPAPSKGLSLEWAAGKEDHFIGLGTRDFTPSPAQAQATGMGQMIAVKKGAPLVIAPRQKQTSMRGWLLAANGSEVGIIPMDAVQVTSFEKVSHGAASNSEPDAGSTEEKC